MPQTPENTDFEISYGHEPKSNPLSIKSNQIYKADPKIIATQKSSDLPAMEHFDSNLDDYVTVPDGTVTEGDFRSFNDYDEDDTYVQPKGLNSSVDVWDGCKFRFPDSEKTFYWWINLNTK